MSLKSSVLLTIILINVFSFCYGQPSPVARHGALQVKNGQLVDRHGRPPQLRGISLSWSIWGGKKYYTPEVVHWLKSDFKINLLRVSMAIEPDGGYLQKPEAQERLITTVVDAAVKEGIYVLIDWHDHHANVNLEASKAFFDKISKRYAGVPNVIYEIWNEPEKISWLTVKKYAVEVISVIRKNDPSNVIVVGSPNWDQDVDIAAQNPVTGFRNIAYSFHFYASDPNHQEKLRAKADAAIQAGLALFVTEWGVGESNGNGIFDRGKTTEWWSWMEKNKLSSANWNITDKAETTALLLKGASDKGNWKLDQLSPAGIYIRKQLRTFNK